MRPHLFILRLGVLDYPIIPARKMDIEPLDLVHSVRGKGVSSVHHNSKEFQQVE